MFVSYSYSVDMNRAEIKLNTKAVNKNLEKDEIYLDRESDGFIAHIRMKRNKKIYDEQKWSLQCKEKGIAAGRMWSKGYLTDLLITVIVGLLVLASIGFSFVMTDIRLELILVGLALILVLLFYIWKRIFTPIVALKIFLIKQL